MMNNSRHISSNEQRFEFLEYFIIIYNKIHNFVERMVQFYAIGLMSILIMVISIQKCKYISSVLYTVWCFFPNNMWLFPGNMQFHIYMAHLLSANVSRIFLNWESQICITAYVIWVKRLHSILRDAANWQKDLYKE